MSRKIVLPDTPALRRVRELLVTRGHVQDVVARDGASRPLLARLDEISTEIRSLLPATGVFKAVNLYALVLLLLALPAAAQLTAQFPLVPIGTKVACPKPPPCESSTYDEALDMWTHEPPGCTTEPDAEQDVEIWVPMNTVVEDHPDHTVHETGVYMRCVRRKDTQEVKGLNVIMLPEPDPTAGLLAGVMLLAAAARVRGC